MYPKHVFQTQTLRGFFEMFNVNGVHLFILIVKGKTQIYCMEDFLSFGTVRISYFMPLCTLVLWHLLST